MLAVETVAALLLLVAVPLLLIAGRQRLLTRRGGTIDVSLRRRHALPGRGWAQGLGRFSGDDLEWYPVFSLAPRPRRTLSRCDLVIVRRRPPTGGEVLAVLSGAIVMEWTRGAPLAAAASTAGLVDPPPATLADAASCLRRRARARPLPSRASACRALAPAQPAGRRRCAATARRPAAT